MEDIKTSLDKILAKFNDSVSHSAPKKLTFEHLSDSFNDSGTIPKKRRLSQSFEDNGLNISLNTSNVSLNSSAAPPPSPWETRRMKADLIEARTRISKLKQEVERLHKLRQESETLYESRVSELKKQCEFSSNKIQDLEKHMQLLRKREHAAKQDLIKAQSDLQQQKHGYEEVIIKLQRAKHEVEENARLVQNSMANELGEYKRHAEKIELELELSCDELESLRSQMDDLKSKACCYDDLKLDNEKVNQELENANQRIKELEFEIASYNDWKEITKNSQDRLLSIPNMDKELERLRSNNKHLQELLGNKLLLEEQVYDLRSRLEREEGARSEVVALQVQLKHAQEEVKEWVKVAQDHCSPNMLVSPLALRARIEELLQHDVLMASEKNTKASESKTMESELLDYKQKCEIYSKNMEELNVALKRHKAFKDRVQKKLLLVSKERDCYKQLLENFEKDLTISNPIAPDLSSTENQLKTRIEMLEKTLVGYKDMCASLEKELNTAKSLPNSDPTGDQSSVNMSVDANATGYEHFKKELDTLRMENERLRRRKEELELELEHRCLKGDFNMEKYKVVHMRLNPANEAYENADNLIEKLQAEIERLKRKNKKLEEDNEVTQARLNETTNITMNFKEINQLRGELESMNSKMKKMKECYKSASMEFREVVYMLFGYRIDRVGSNTNYKISSMYAEDPDHYLNFRLNESNMLDMLETPYSATLKSLIETQLVGNKSLPAFLSALTLDLFQKATITLS
ncbi:mitotic spindle assembly checkpoint protein MAD1 [Musca domestica]|uniref:Mitotic spindle assembly checkpoint protein MAD1 n=1 Tax=Musca domestica TaxID=7370 RepID=A0A1I8MY74_MUSDO|nr:mitotic spindle assembly checkpoint protein MAD1 [Musca domestica]